MSIGLWIASAAYFLLAGGFIVLVLVGAVANAFNDYRADTTSPYPSPFLRREYDI